MKKGKEGRPKVVPFPVVQPQNNGFDVQPPGAPDLQ
jgi:hypothetical protein